MTMHVQDYLKLPCNSLDTLKADWGIDVTHHDRLPLVLLNYGIESQPYKFEPLVRECRCLVLEKGTWDVVGRSFPRFFNAGEYPAEEKDFKWEGAVAYEKADGSLMTLSAYKGEWVVTTRRTFAQGVVEGSGKTWRELFWSCLDLGKLGPARDNPPGLTFVFEFVSPWTQVVQYHPQPALYLLAIFNRDGGEGEDFQVNLAAHRLGVRRPERFVNPRLDAIRFVLDAAPATFEGYVVRDPFGRRLKVKNKRYVELHVLAANGNLASQKELLPLVLRGEADETLSYFPHILPAYLDVLEGLYGVHGRLKKIWELSRGMDSQKDFALFVKAHAREYTPLLFQARKTSFEAAWVESADFLLKQAKLKGVT